MPYFAFYAAVWLNCVLVPLLNNAKKDPSPPKPSVPLSPEASFLMTVSMGVTVSVIVCFWGFVLWSIARDGRKISQNIKERDLRSALQDEKHKEIMRTFQDKPRIVSPDIQKLIDRGY